MAAISSRTFGILTSGGDCPGLNAAIRGVAKPAVTKYGMRVIGIPNGFRGLIDGSTRVLQAEAFDGLLTQGGTILGTSREKPFAQVVPENGMKDSVAGRSKPKKIVENYRALGLDCLVVLGGNGTHKTARLLADRGLNVIGLPKTIDNDIWGTDVSFGFHSAVDIATEAIDRLHTTAHSHNRVMVIEVMGHKAGWLALYSGLAGGGDVIIIPEIPYDIRNIAEHLRHRRDRGKAFSIVVVAEGAVSKEEAAKSGAAPPDVPAGERSIGYRVAKEIQESTGMDTRVTVLGYQQRGGPPSPYDRLLATRFGTAAAEMLHRGEFGKMVALEGKRIISRPLGEIAGKLKLVPENDDLVETGRSVGVCFGDGR
ncbi:MAG: 6-phosphofructokinase [Alkalispirochaetaceae bacterium]